MNFVVSERGVEGTSFGEIGVFVTGCRDAGVNGEEGREGEPPRGKRAEEREERWQSRRPLQLPPLELGAIRPSLSLSLFLFFSFEKKTASPAAPRSRRKCARFAPPPQQAREFGPCCTKGTRRDATGGARSGEKAGSMVEAPRPKSYLNAPPSLCLLELFFPFFALFHPAKRRKKLSLHLARRRPSKRRRRGFSRGPGGGVRSRAIVRTARSTNSEGHGYEAGRGRKGKEEGVSRCDERTKTTKGEKKTHFLCFSRCPCFPS